MSWTLVWQAIIAGLVVLIPVVFVWISQWFKGKGLALELKNLQLGLELASAERKRQTVSIEKIEELSVETKKLGETTHAIVNSQRTAMEKVISDQRTTFDAQMEAMRGEHERQLAAMREELHTARMQLTQSIGAQTGDKATTAAIEKIDDIVQGQAAPPAPDAPHPER